MLLSTLIRDHQFSVTRAGKPFVQIPIGFLRRPRTQFKPVRERFAAIFKEDG